MTFLFMRISIDAFRALIGFINKNSVIVMYLYLRYESYFGYEFNTFGCRR